MGEAWKYIVSGAIAVLINIGIITYYLHKEKTHNPIYSHLQHSPIREYISAKTCVNFIENTAKLSLNEEKNWQLFEQKIIDSQQENLPYGKKGLMIRVLQKDSVKANKKLYETRKKFLINNLPNVEKMLNIDFSDEKSPCDAVVEIHTHIGNDDKNAVNKICYPDRYGIGDELICTTKYQCKCSLEGKLEINRYNDMLFSQLDNVVRDFIYQENLKYTPKKEEL